MKKKNKIETEAEDQVSGSAGDEKTETSEQSENKEKETVEDPSKDETEDTIKELQEFKDKYLRLYSEFENFRKRTNKEKLELISTANERLILELLPVVDDFERAEKSMDGATEVQAVKDGVNLIKEKLEKILESKGLKAIEAKGKDFDSDFHEGITQIPAPEESLKGKIVDEVEKGYKLGDKVIRYSKVVIGS